MRRHLPRLGPVVLGVAIGLPVLALLAIAGLTIAVVGQRADRPPATLVGPTDERTYTRVPDVR